MPDVPRSTPVPYPNDPQDPSKPGDPIIPDIPGYTPVDSDGKSLKPGDSYPVDPNKPGTDTPLHYQANDQKAQVSYTGQTTGKTITTDSFTGKSDKISDYRTKSTIDKLTKQEYEFVSDDYPTNGVVFDRDDHTDQKFTVVMKHKSVTITPEKPGQPGQPTDPNNSAGPKYPDGSDYQNLTKDAKQTIHYIGPGTKTPIDQVTVEKSAFKRTMLIDMVTGKVIAISGWTGIKTFDKFNVPVIDGYHADKRVAGGLTATPQKPSVREVVQYQKTVH